MKHLQSRFRLDPIAHRKQNLDVGYFQIVNEIKESHLYGRPQRFWQPLILVCQIF